MEILNGNIKAYCVCINGRSIEDEDQHFPIYNSSIDNNYQWHFNFKLAVDNYLNCIVKDIDDEHGLNSELYKDYIVCLYSIDINIEVFENKFEIDFDIDNDMVIELIPYYVDYNFNTVAERIGNFLD